jgi:transcriptional regulator with XRE-family HTH domain
MSGVLVGTRLREARKAAGLSQQQLADVIGTHVMVVSAWERNTRAPNGDSLDALAGALGVSVDYLLGRSDDPTGVITQSDLSAYELHIIGLVRQRNVAALLRVVTDIADDMQQHGIAGGDETALDKSAGGGGE